MIRNISLYRCPYVRLCNFLSPNAYRPPTLQALIERGSVIHLNLAQSGKYRSAALWASFFYEKLSIITEPMARSVIWNVIGQFSISILVLTMW